MADSTPRCSPVALLLMLASLAMLVMARYKWGFLEDKEWQLVHVLIGWTACVSIFVAFHGVGALARIGRETWFVLGFGLTCFMLFWYFGRSDGYRSFFGDPPLDYETFWPIVPFMYFATMATLLRLVIPLIAQRLLFGRRPSELGMPLSRGHREGAVPGIGWVYVLLFVGLLPVLVLVAQTEPFQQKYPLARDLIDPHGGIWWAHLLVFECFYFLVFLSGEGFWRGYLTFGTERDLGLYGLAFMAVPYVTAHFGKPFSEALGAIAAGVALGFLALRHRSIWWGVALHYAVALTMDLLSIANQGAVIYVAGASGGDVPMSIDQTSRSCLSGRVLAIDWGLARIGLALSDATRTLASPWPALHEKDKRAQIERVVELVRSEEVVHVLVGLPRHLDGRESASTRSARRYAEKLATVIAAPVELVDERYTSVEAQDRLREGSSWKPQGAPGTAARGHTTRGGGRPMTPVTSGTRGVSTPLPRPSCSRAGLTRAPQSSPEPGSSPRQSGALRQATGQGGRRGWRSGS